MPVTDYVDRAKIVERIEELRSGMEEVATLEGILDVLDGKAPSRRNGPRGTSATASRPGSRARRGSRPEEFVAAVTDSPGITATDLAAEMGCNVNYVYRLAKELDDKVEKRDKGFYLKGQAPEAPEAEDEAEADGE